MLKSALNGSGINTGRTDEISSKLLTPVELVSDLEVIDEQPHPGFGDMVKAQQQEQKIEHPKSPAFQSKKFSKPIRDQDEVNT